MPADVLEIWLDVEEPRRSLEPANILVDGRSWNNAKSTAAIDVVTMTGLLYPLPFTPEWRSTFTGNYTRLKKENYTLTTPAKWKNFEKGATGNTYLQAQGAGSETVTTQQQWDRNQGFYLSWFGYNSGSDKFIQLQCGWGTFSGSAGSSIWFQFWSDGSVDVYLAADKLGDGNIDKYTAGTWKQLGQEPPTNKARGGSGPGGTTQENNYISALLMPCRGRDILVVSDRGGGFAYTHKLIGEDEEDPEITPPGTFWWRVPNGAATVQCAPLRFRTTGALVSEVMAFRRPPYADEESEVRWIYDPPGYGVPPGVDGYLVEEDGVTPFAPDGDKTSCRVRVDLTGDGTNTPFIYSVAASFPGLLALTSGAEATELTPYAPKKNPPSLSVSDDFGDVRFSMTLKAPAEIEAQGAVSLAYMSNRPVAVYIGAQEIFRGRTEAPEWEERFSDAARDLTLEVRDWWAALENYRFQEAIPLDGMRLDLAFAYLVTLAGFPDSALDIEPIDFFLPTAASSSQGEYTLKPEEAKDTAADIVRKLWETYASIFFIGFKPTIDGTKFVVRSPSSINAQVPVLLFTNDTDAQFYGGYPSGLYGPRIKNYKQTTLAPEANDIYVHGRTSRGERFFAHVNDPDSINPALPPSQRPANWLGEYRRFAWFDAGITTYNAASWACSVFALKLYPVRVLAEWECDFLAKYDGSPVWRGDLVAIYGYGVFKIDSLSCEFRLEDGMTPAIYRPTKYVGSKVADFP